MAIPEELPPVATPPCHNGDTTATGDAGIGKAHTQALRCAMERSQFVRRCAQSLLLDSAVTATAIILCQQFCAQRSESQFDHHVIGGACVFLATKSCEVPRTLRSVVNVVHAVLNETTEPLGADQAYANLKNSIINAEQTVLRVLRFDIDVVLPHSFLLNYARHLQLKESTTQCAVALVNDVVCTTEALRFPPTTLAAGCLYLACQIMQKNEPIAGETNWWYHYDTSDEDILAITQLVENISNVTETASQERKGRITTQH